MIAMKIDDFKQQKRIIFGHIKRDRPLRSFKMILIFRMIVVIGFIVGVCGRSLQDEDTPSTEPSIGPTRSIPTYLPTTAAPTIEPGIPTARPTLTAFPSAKPTVWPTVEAGAPTMAPTIPVITYVEANQVFAGLTSEEAQSVAFKATVRSSIAYALNLDFSDVLINSVTLASIRRSVLAGYATVSYTIMLINDDPVAIAATLQSPAAVTAVTVAMAVGGYKITTQAPITTVVKASPAPASSPTAATMDATTLIGVICGASIGGFFLCVGLFYFVRTWSNKRKQATAVAMARQSVIGGQSDISFRISSNRQAGGVLAITPGAAIGPEAVNPTHIGFVPRVEPRAKVDSLALPVVHSAKTHSAKTGSVKTGSIREPHTRDPPTIRDIRLSFAGGTTPRDHTPTRDPHTREPRISFGGGITPRDRTPPREQPHTREARLSFNPGAPFTPRSHTSRSTPVVKVDSLAPEVRNKTAWKDSPWVLKEESEISKSELVTPMPSGKVGPNAPGKKETLEFNARL